MAWDEPQYAYTYYLLLLFMDLWNSYDGDGTSQNLMLEEFVWISAVKQNCRQVDSTEWKENNVSGKIGRKNAENVSFSIGRCPPHIPDTQT